MDILNNISSSTGGGICAYGSTLSLFRVLFAENESHGYFGWNVMPSGSAVHTENSSILFNHITISNNLATGGYDFGVIYGKHSDVKIVNSILWANNPDSILCDSSNFFICNSIISNGIKSVKYDDYGKLYWMNDNIDINPEFIITSLSNYHLNSSSPAIDEAYADTLIIYNEGNDSLRLPQS